MTLTRMADPLVQIPRLPHHPSSNIKNNLDGTGSPIGSSSKRFCNAVKGKAVRN